jgi:stage V sporulation protein R
MTEPLWTDSEWTFPLIDKVYTEIEKIGVGELGLNIYRNELEIISSEQMLDAYSSIGMPVFYRHWSFGKHFARNKQMYSAGMQGLAYEIVINSDPTISYLMEENTMTMQALVIAHAAFGHNHFFKNNALFRSWTDASSIIDYLVFARDYIAKCEEREGRKEVERFLDSCHALMNHAVNCFKRPGRLSAEKEKKRQRERDDFAQLRVNDLFDSLLKPSAKEKSEIFPREPEENILYFCEKFAPDLKDWQRELIRIVRKIAQYFHPQVQTKVMNEGCLVAGNLIATSNGMIPIEEIVQQRRVTAVWDGSAWRKVYGWVEHTPKRRIKLITHHGYEVHGGADHKLLINGEWKELNDIQIGDELPIAVDNCVFAQEQVDLPPVKFAMHLTHEQISECTGIKPSYYRSVVTGRHSCSEDRLAAFALHHALFKEHVENRFDQSTETMLYAPTTLTEDFAYWLGVLIGDGSMSDRGRAVSIVNADHEVIHDWTRIGENLFGLKAAVAPELGKTRVHFHSLTLLRWLRDNLDIKVGYAAPVKQVPSLILRSPRSVIMAFIRGLFDADGCATKQVGGCVIYVSKSDTLASTVQELLLRFGIVCRVSTQIDSCNRLIISGQDAEIFTDEIGFGFGRKQSIMTEMVAKSRWRKERVITTTVVAKEEDFGPTFDFSVEETHRYTSGAFIHHNCATYVHYRILTRMHDLGMMTDGAYYEFIRSHTNVVFQPEFDDRRYDGINPYALGFAMMRDISRICKEPSDEDRKWFPSFAGCGDDMGVLKDAWKNFRDESFIRQFLSPKLIRDFKLFRVKDNHKEDHLQVTAIHNDRGYDDLRSSLADRYELHSMYPQLEVVKVDPKTRTLYITYRSYRGRALQNPNVMVNHIQTLWGGHPVVIEDDKGNHLVSIIAT